MKTSANNTSDYTLSFSIRFNPDPDDEGNSWKSVYILNRCPLPEA